MSKIKTPTVGTILKEEFMEPNNISSYRLAKDINVPVSRILNIIHNERKITIDTSLRLGKYFNVSDTYFISLQNEIDIRNTKNKIDDELNSIVPFALKNNK